MKITEFLEKQEELEKVFFDARKAHPKPIKAKNARKNVIAQTHDIGTYPEKCEYCKAIVDAVKALNDHDKDNLGLTRFDMTTTKTAIRFVRAVVKMMKEDGEL